MSSARAEFKAYREKVKEFINKIDDHGGLYDKDMFILKYNLKPFTNEFKNDVSYLERNMLVNTLVYDEAFCLPYEDIHDFCADFGSVSLDFVDIDSEENEDYEWCYRIDGVGMYTTLLYNASFNKWYFYALSQMERDVQPDEYDDDDTRSCQDYTNSCRLKVDREVVHELNTWGCFSEKRETTIA